jgi:hypothetical protein
VSVTRAAVTTAAKSIAQDPGGTTKLLLTDGDYDLAIDQAIEHFRADRPNLRVVHHTVTVAAFRFVLLGAGFLAGLAGLDAWIDGASQLRDVFTGYRTDTPDNLPLERNNWRVRREPGPLVVLELLDGNATVADVLRLEFTAPHTIHASSAASTSLLAGDVRAFEILDAAKICEMTARRYVQNTGTSTFQNETVDRRSQSDIMAARAKDLLKQYGEIVGKASGEVAGAAATRKMEIATTHRRGRLWQRG